MYLSFSFESAYSNNFQSLLGAYMQKRTCFLKKGTWIKIKQIYLDSPVICLMCLENVTTANKWHSVCAFYLCILEHSMLFNKILWSDTTLYPVNSVAIYHPLYIDLHGNRGMAYRSRTTNNKNICSVPWYLKVEDAE